MPIVGAVSIVTVMHTMTTVAAMTVAAQGVVPMAARQVLGHHLGQMVVGALQHARLLRGQVSQQGGLVVGLVVGRMAVL